VGFDHHGVVQIRRGGTGESAVSEQPPRRSEGERDPAEIDTAVVHAARVYDYMLGGTTNFMVDRMAAKAVTSFVPGGLETASIGVRANRAFLGHAVRTLVGDVGIRQFLDLGTGIPGDDNVHAVAQRQAPESRVVYVDHDPVVLAHAHALLRSTTEGRTAYVDGDLRDPETILQRAAATLDFDRPVGLMLVAVMHYLVDDDKPYEVMHRLVEAVPSGSYVVLSHLAIDILPEEMKPIAQLVDAVQGTVQLLFENVVFRTHAEVARFLDGLDVLPPGLAPLHEWPLTGPLAPPEGKEIPVYAAIARKP
jgi:S-adenosyl methyltransferase